jgi:hypothetical protein
VFTNGEGLVVHTMIAGYPNFEHNRRKGKLHCGDRSPRDRRFHNDRVARDAASPESTRAITTATFAPAVMPALNLRVVIRPVRIVGSGPRALSLKER